MISSIPLSKLGLPPVIVTMAHKRDYFAALKRADTVSDLIPLSDFLRNSILEAMTDIAFIPSIEVLSEETATPRQRRSRWGPGAALSDSCKDSR